MLDAVKDYLTPKTFGILIYICSIVHILYGLIFTAIIIALKEGEPAKFTCYVAVESTLVYKTQVDKACYSSYQQKYNAPLQFYLFVILSIWSPIIVALIYSLRVRRRVEQVDLIINLAEDNDEAANQGQNTGSSYVFYLYFIHLAIRALFGMLLTILQYIVFFPNGFEFEFNCGLNTTQFTPLNVTSVACENPSAPEKHISWVILSSFNSGFALIMVLEMIRLCQRFPKCNYTQFIAVYLLRTQYAPVEIEMRPLRVNDQESTVESDLQQCIDYYKEQVLCVRRSVHVFSAPKTSLNDLYVDLVIHTEQAEQKFSEHMQRHEIYDVYMKVPPSSVQLQNVKDIFYPNEDTKGHFPKTILAMGRPGIGKTVLTEKIMHDWASGVDDYYNEKIVFYYKFFWFNDQEMNDITLKTFLRIGTRLCDEKFDKIYEYVTKDSEKAILVFDGLDEFNGNSDCLNKPPSPDDSNFCMSGMALFAKSISRCFLPKATILVTSRPTAHEFYSRFILDRTVEILGFNEHRIKEFVEKFCDNNSNGSLKPQLWRSIKSNSDILNLCYIPVNWWIISSILFQCLKTDSENASHRTVPNTITELYQEAIIHFDKYRFRNAAKASANRKLQELAFKGIENGQLAFSNNSFDEQMKKSGLLNKLFNPYCQAQQHFCFIHLTLLENTIHIARPLATLYKIICEYLYELVITI